MISVNQRKVWQFSNEKDLGDGMNGDYGIGRTNQPLQNTSVAPTIT